MTRSAVTRSTATNARSAVTRSAVTRYVETAIPSSLPNLAAWWKADSLGLTDGTVVTTWTDSSGNGISAVQNTTTNKPIYKTGILNGNPVVRFDGINDRLDATPDPTSGLSGATVFVVASFAVPSGNSIPVIQQNTSGWRFQQFSNQMLGQSNYSGAHTQTSANVWTNIYNGANATATRIAMRRNARPFGAYISGVIPSPLPASTGIGIGDLYATLAAPHQGDIAEIVIYTRALSTYECLLIERYLAGKYGTQTV